MNESQLLDKAKEVLEDEGNIIEFDGGGAVFIGDTHGDLEATRRVFNNYPPSEYHLIFLGDYVDRGSQSRENIWYLLQKKIDYPHKVYLLMGNHEGWKFSKFSPADFWSGLKTGEREKYEDTLAQLPLAAHSKNGIIATHGGLPDVNSLEEIEGISPGSDDWRMLTWGDWSETPTASSVGYGGRPRLGVDYFKRIMDRLNKKVMIRSHQPHLPQYMYDDRLLTIFTSSAYGQVTGGRRVAVADMETEIKTVRDLKIEMI